MEEVHLLFCAHLINIFLLFMGVELRHFFSSEMQRGCQVCAVCNSNRFHSFIFKLCIMIVHTSKMCIGNTVSRAELGLVLVEKKENYFLICTLN